MAQDTEITEIVDNDGTLVGPIRRPRNAGAAGAGSIHDDETARAVGFRGGTIAGSTHMNQFPPVLLRAFGNRWFETGSLSCYFQNATISDEPVRCFVEVPPAGASDAQVRAWMEQDNGTQVLEATAAVGSPAEPTLLRHRLAAPLPRGDTRIYAHLEPGMVMEPQPARAQAVAPSRLQLMTEPLDWYAGPSPWGGPILAPGNLAQMMRRGEQSVRRPAGSGDGQARGGGVGLFGAIEIRQIRGPVFVDHDYEVTGSVLAVGETPKSEYFWYESVLREPHGGRDVAAMIMMIRIMKASSPLWKDQG